MKMNKGKGCKTLPFEVHLHDHIMGASLEADEDCEGCASSVQSTLLA